MATFLSAAQSTVHFLQGLQNPPHPSHRPFARASVASTAPLPVPCSGLQSMAPVNPAPDSPLPAWVPSSMPHAAPAVRVRCRPESLERHGGLVIAGRLEDVCAELDRLVALQELH